MAQCYLSLAPLRQGLGCRQFIWSLNPGSLSTGVETLDRGGRKASKQGSNAQVAAVGLWAPSH